MLTGYQCEIVAFIGDGEIICRDCAHRALDEGQFARSERGLGELSPLIRYSIDELNGERAYEAAEERLRDFVDDHPAFSRCLFEEGQDLGDGFVWRHRWSTNGYRALDHLVEKFGNTYAERCGDCGEEIS